MKVLSKKLSYVLRHDPQSIGIILDSSGYCDVAELIEKLSFDGTEITFSLIDETVQNDKKNRFSFNADKTKIRANYGHSFPVDLEVKSVKPPDILYHGTATQSINGILRGGIKKRKRNHVHLSDDYFIAYMFNGNVYLKNKLVLAVLQDYVANNMEVTCYELKSAFDKSLQGSIGVVEYEDIAKQRKDYQVRFFSKEDEILRLSDGNMIVCSQWGILNIPNFIKRAEQLGYKIEQIARD